MTTPVFRFAPSPNGLLHLGHAYSALLNADLARAADGRLLLRIEDIDRDRSRPEFEAAILGDCEWLGLRFETRVRRQSEHLGDYRTAIDALRRRGLVYPAFKSRAEVARAVKNAEKDGVRWPRDPDGMPLYPGAERALPDDEADARIAAAQPFALRLNVAAAVEQAGPLHWQEMDEGGAVTSVAADPAVWGDVVLAGRGAVAAYHIAVVVDDAAQGVTHIVRGRDLFAATAIHRLLQALLGLPEPIYRHHKLIRDRKGRKLAKSDGDVGLSSLRDRGATPAGIRERLGLGPTKN